MPRMETLYLVCLLVGGFFVALSMFGGESDSGVDTDADVDAGFDGDVHIELEADSGSDLHLEADSSTDFDHDLSGGHADVGFVDLLTLRFVFLFAAFFGLTGTLLNLIDAGEPFTLWVSVLTGLVVGLGGNYFIKTVGYRNVSSDITGRDLIGRTAQVMLPFSPGEHGKIRLISKGRQVTMVAASLDEDSDEEFNEGDSVVVVGLKGPVAEVIKPD